MRLAGRQPHHYRDTSIDSAYRSLAAFRHRFHKGLKLVRVALRVTVHEEVQWQILPDGIRCRYHRLIRIAVAR